MPLPDGGAGGLVLSPATAKTHVSRAMIKLGARDRARLTLTLRGKRLGLKLAEVKELVDLYETQRDSQTQLRRFVDVLARQRAALEVRLADLRATLDEVVAHEAATRRLLKARST